MSWAKKANGVMVSQVMPFPFNGTTPISREYLDAVAKAGGGATPNYSSMEGYVAAKVLAEGLRQAGRGPSREGLIARLESRCATGTWAACGWTSGRATTWPRSPSWS